MNFNARQADHYELAGPARNFPHEEIVYNAQFGEELDWAGENPMVVNRIDQAQREWADLGCPDAPEHFDPMGRGPRGMPGWLALIRLTDHETRWTRSQQVLPLTYLHHVRFEMGIPTLLLCFDLLGQILSTWCSFGTFSMGMSYCSLSLLLSAY